MQKHECTFCVTKVLETGIRIEVSCTASSDTANSIDFANEAARAAMEVCSILGEDAKKDELGLKIDDVNSAGSIRG